MRSDLSTIALPQIGELIDKYQKMRTRSKWDDCSDLSSVELNEFVSQVMTTIHRIVGENNKFSQQADSLLTDKRTTY